MTSWATRGKTAINNQTTSTQKPGLKLTKPNKYGEPRLAQLKEVKPELYKKGSFGVTFTYDVDGEQYPVRDRIVLTDAAGKSTPYGASTIKRRLLAYGLEESAIASFPIPDNDSSMSPAAKALAALVPQDICVYLRDGKPYTNKAGQETVGKEISLVVPINDSPLKNA